MMKERFSDAQVGDLVYCRLNGEGRIDLVLDLRFPLRINFRDDVETYDRTGRTRMSHVEPTLFYRNGENRYLTERPEPPPLTGLKLNRVLCVT